MNDDERRPPDQPADGPEPPEVPHGEPDPNGPWPEPEPDDEPTAPPPLPEPETPTPPPEPGPYPEPGPHPEPGTPDPGLAEPDIPDPSVADPFGVGRHDPAAAPGVPDPFDGPLPPQAFGDAVGPTPPPPGMGPPPSGVGSPAQPPGGVHRAGAQPRTGPGGTRLALWPTRALSALVDWFGPGLIAGLFFQRASVGVATFALTLVLVWALYNAWLAGTTGQSYGKRLAGTRLVRADNGQLLGGWLAIGRHLLHILDALPCYLGYLWPLWDEKRQTFADKIVRSQVVHA
jgi:uncharacterized RDD family membrane protein YckC